MLRIDAACKQYTEVGAVFICLPCWLSTFLGSSLLQWALNDLRENYTVLQQYEYDRTDFSRSAPRIDGYAAYALEANLLFSHNFPFLLKTYIPFANVDSSQHDLYSEHLWTTSKRWKHRHIGLVLPTLRGFCIGSATQVATRGSILYFVIADLANINPMQLASLFVCLVRWNSCWIGEESPNLSRYEIYYIHIDTKSSLSNKLNVNVLHPKFHNTKSIVGWPSSFAPRWHALGFFLSRNTRYQFSLFYFVRLFKTCMDKAAKSDAPQWLPCCFKLVMMWMQATQQRPRWWYWYPHDQLGKPDLVWNLPECVQRRHWVHFWTRRQSIILSG